MLFYLLACEDSPPIHFYQTDRMDETTTEYDCLYYKSLRKNYRYTLEIKEIYQIIPYFVRSMSENVKMNNDEYLNITFEELKHEKATWQDLYRWLAPIDLIERYVISLNDSNPSNCSSSQIYSKCSMDWFGPFCQYPTYGPNSFDTFVEFGLRVGTDPLCYSYLVCDRGSPKSCLDWREIWDGKIDCFNGGIDEEQCFTLEMNECDKDEYRCHNGLCIPDNF